MVPIILVAAAIATTATLPDRGIDAPYPNSWNGVIYAPTPFTTSADQAHQERLIALRNETLEQQGRDGGALTPEHRGELQRKLDLIQVRYGEDRRRADLFSVDAGGKAVYSAGTRPKVVLPPGMRFEDAAR